MNPLIIVALVLFGLAESVSTDLGGPTPMTDFYQGTCAAAEGTWNDATTESMAECSDVQWRELIPKKEPR